MQRPSPWGHICFSPSLNHPYNRRIIYKILCKRTCQTCFSGERHKAPWASCSNYSKGFQTNVLPICHDLHV